MSALYYMPTIRADVFVCSATHTATHTEEATDGARDGGSATDGAPGAGLALNVLVFQQSLCCECESDDRTRPVCVRDAAWKELLPYWLCRITSARNELSTTRGSERTKGLYDERVRRRLVERVAARSGQPIAVPAQKARWTPPPLPTVLLTPG